MGPWQHTCCFHRSHSYTVAQWSTTSNQKEQELNPDLSGFHIHVEKKKKEEEEDEEEKEEEEGSRKPLSVPL